MSDSSLILDDFKFEDDLSQIKEYLPRSSQIKSKKVLPNPNQNQNQKRKNLITKYNYSQMKLKSEDSFQVINELDLSPDSYNFMSASMQEEQK